MRLVFAHDHVFYKYNNNFYSTGGLSKKMIERYTNVFNEVIILSRQKEINNFDKNLTLSSTAGVKFVKIPDFKSIKKIYRLKNAKQLIKNEVSKADAVIGRLPSSIGSIAIQYARDLSIKSLVEAVACPWDALWNHSIKGKIIAPFEYKRMRKLVYNSKYTIYVTNSFLQQRYPTNGESVNCSNVLISENDHNILEKRIDKIVSKPVNYNMIIGTIASTDVKHKGQQYIIKALGELKKEGITNFQYQLVGKGNNSYLKSIAKRYGVIEQVKFLGAKNHQDIFDWLDSIDIYTQPSRQEGLPRALIEAMSRGLPAIGARTAGIPELLKNEFIFSNSKTNIKEIKTLLLKLNINRNEMLEQSKTNFKESKNYLMEVIDQRRNSFLEDFCKS
ncbi:glycosyltransferase family 4 protein [Oceanobacillus kimchii]|uniref:glycosyltransferase n=1 Tax=Oceanobacillus kimchii TaxID=746691 RepID=UPI0021A89BC1|nr:glycosyltransferase family 4 protein [Oceanobacillus kimchii]MCT2134614.1 glycosyltransferase family 4 protein [Oceanobacillus kimchii]